MFNKAYVFLKKEMLFLIRYPMQIMFETILPVINMLPAIFLAIYLMSSNHIQNFEKVTGTKNYFVFISIGIVFSIFNSIQEQTGYQLSKEMWMGTLEQIWITPIKKFNLILGWIFFSFIKAILYTISSAIILKFIFIYLNISFNIYSLPLLALSILLLLAISICSGIIICSITLSIKQVDSFVFLVTGAIPLLSGITFPISVLPPKIQIISKILPTTYVFDLIRYSILRSNTILDPSIELILVFCYVIILMIISVFIFKQLKRRVEKCGTIYIM
ncbi:ABC-2 type transport system permease protein [Marinitoga hydrogenitolerans DSM 16785]|uniref:Transport permease protein n=1 Tax=Marinitoga hydrogenitolerans (strain DSM 16785 / JCM 12826 / AT1271) TaxID=1122195 RepID=A0A1M5A1V2_MARH1|nr:ABC transporter permease [Marinitoga hydrogenitolerans]SHF24233.1 ABC-2 type transport system permease protein [Marinitoga hydrogenitolerans DSM 16785]